MHGIDRRPEAAGRSVPKFVEREPRAYLACGIPAHGFVHVHCDACGHEFSTTVEFERAVA